MAKNLDLFEDLLSIRSLILLSELLRFVGRCAPLRGHAKKCTNSNIELKIRLENRRKFWKNHHNDDHQNREISLVNLGSTKSPPSIEILFAADSVFAF